MVLRFTYPRDVLSLGIMRQHSLRLDDSLMQAVDSKRGLIPRNTWIVAAIKVALGEDLRMGLTDTGPGPQNPGVPEAERSPDAEIEEIVDSAGEKMVAMAKGTPEATQEPSARQRPTKPPLQRPIIQKREK